MAAQPPIDPPQHNDDFQSPLKKFFQALKFYSNTKKKKSDDSIKAIQFKLRRYLRKFKSFIETMKAKPKKIYFFKKWIKAYSQKTQQRNQIELAWDQYKIKKAFIFLRNQIRRRKQRKRVQQIAKEMHTLRIKDKYFKILRKTTKLESNYQKFKIKKNRRIFFKVLVILRQLNLTSKLKRDCYGKALSIRKGFLLRMCFKRWLPAIHSIWKDEMNLELKKKVLQSWKEFTLLQKIDFERKSRFFRKLLLKKYLLHLWSEKIRQRQLLRIGRNYFLSNIFRKWREEVYKGKVAEKRINKILKSYFQAKILRQKRFAFSKLHITHKRIEALKAKKKVANRHFYNLILKRNKCLILKVFRSFQLFPIVQYIQKKQRHNFLKKSIMIWKIFRMQKKAIRLQAALQDKRADLILEKKYFEKIKKIWKYSAIQNKVAKGFLKSKFLKKYLELWRLYVQFVNISKAYKAQTLFFKHLKKKMFMILFINKCKAQIIKSNYTLVEEKEKKRKKELIYICFKALQNHSLSQSLYIQ